MKKSNKFDKWFNKCIGLQIKCYYQIIGEPTPRESWQACRDEIIKYIKSHTYKDLDTLISKIEKNF